MRELDNQNPAACGGSIKARLSNQNSVSCCMAHAIDSKHKLLKVLSSNVLEAHKQLRKCQEDMRQQRSFIRRIKRIPAGRRWVDVSKVDLKQGKLYIIRHMTGPRGKKKTSSEVKIAIWWGEWMPVHGCLGISIQLDDTVLVWR